MSASRFLWTHPGNSLWAWSRLVARKALEMCWVVNTLNSVVWCFNCVSSMNFYRFRVNRKCLTIMLSSGSCFRLTTQETVHAFYLLDLACYFSQLNWLNCCLNNRSTLKFGILRTEEDSKYRRRKFKRFCSICPAVTLSILLPFKWDRLDFWVSRNNLTILHGRSSFLGERAKDQVSIARDFQTF